MNFKNILRFNGQLTKKFSTKAQIKVIPDEEVIYKIDNKTIKLRDHPGINKPRAIIIPNAFIKAVVNVTQDQPLNQLIAKSIELNSHLKHKNPPLEHEELKMIARKTQNKVLSQCQNIEINSESDEMRFRQIVQNKVNDSLRKKVYNWKPVIYDDFKALVYLIGRSAPEYGVLVRIFSEIHRRDQEFKPRSFFDFGSGVGTALWAANTFWNQHIFEYFNVDSSPSMNDLSQILLQGGRGNSASLIKGIFYRQFLPANNTSYDLVVSAYSLMELPSQEARLKTILNLWNKTEKYLVLVEQGTNAGFKVINEARDFILQIDTESSKGHVFAPCPHDLICPRYTLNDGTPCNFEVTYFSLPISGAASAAKKELFSYVVLKKGKKDECDPQWPRVVRSPLIRSKHTICRMCTSEGKLSEVIFTASKHGKTTYQCARATSWGDLVPIKLQTIDADNNVEDINKID